MNFKRMVFFLDLYYESTVLRLFSSRDLSPFNYHYHFESNKYCCQIQQRAASEFCSSSLMTSRKNGLRLLMILGNLQVLMGSLLGFKSNGSPGKEENIMSGWAVKLRSV